MLKVCFGACSKFEIAEQAAQTTRCCWHALQNAHLNEHNSTNNVAMDVATLCFGVVVGYPDVHGVVVLIVQGTLVI